MLSLHPSRDLVYVVVKPIPDPLHPGRTLAEPGDEVIVRTYDLKFPITVLRRLPLELAMAFPDSAVSPPFSYEPASDAPVSERSSDLRGERSLRLLRRAE
jgi:hypothetical protein